MSNLKKLSVLGLIFIFVAFFVLVTAGATLQAHLGSMGLFLSEVLLALCAVVFAIFCKLPLREVFALQMPTLKGTLGTFLMWIFGFGAATVATYALTLFFPHKLFETANQLNSFFFNESFVLSLFLFALTPAVCEEMLFRGFFLSSLYPLKKDYIIVIICGTVFGIFHTDFIRFIPTAILGSVLTIIMLKTKNIFYPALFHFLNNSLSVFANTVSFSSQTNTQQSIQLIEAIPFALRFTSLGIYICLSFLLPVILFFALKLLSFSKIKMPSKLSEGIVPYAVSCALIAGLGFITIVISMIVYISKVIF